MPLFKAWSEEQENKQAEQEIVVAKNFAEHVSRDKRFGLFPKVSDSVFPGGWGI